MPPLLRFLIGFAGAYVLADSLSQLLVTVAPWQADSIVWRATALRTLFTQITPLALAALLLGMALVRSGPAARLAAGTLGLSGLVLVGLWALLLVEGRSAGPGPDPDPNHRYVRGTAQALISAAAWMLGLLAASARLWRAGREDRLRPAAGAAAAE